VSETILNNHILGLHKWLESLALKFNSTISSSLKLETYKEAYFRDGKATIYPDGIL
jgi:hypothetical protein